MPRKQTLSKGIHSSGNLTLISPSGFGQASAGKSQRLFLEDGTTIVRALPNTATLAILRISSRARSRRRRSSRQVEGRRRRRDGKAGAPAHAGASDIGPVEIRDQPVDQRLGTACSRPTTATTTAGSRRIRPDKNWHVTWAGMQEPVGFLFRRTDNIQPGRPSRAIDYLMASRDSLGKSSQA